MGLRSFFGILPPKLYYKDVSAPIEALPVPEKITLLWYRRTPSDLAVRVGTKVETGQDLARNGRGPFVSTVTGRVEEASTFLGVDSREYLAVQIRADQKDSFDPSVTSVAGLSETQPQTLRTGVNRAGFTALGPIIRDPRVWPTIDCLIISALDLDPLSIVNQQTFRDNPEQVEAAIELLARTTEASQCVLAVPDNLADIVSRVSTGAATVAMVPPVYPNGLPEILAKKYGAGLLMKTYDAGFAGNTVVVSLEHALAMVSCLQSGRPMLEKTVTLSSGQDGKLRNFRVRIGTPVGEILKRASVEVQPKGKLILNGIMRGYSCFSDEQPITATTESVHIQSASEVTFFQNTQCTNCGKCNSICPVDLEVNILGRLSEYGIFNKCRGLGVENCIECGLCAYVCPARRPLVHFMTLAKQGIKTVTDEPANMEEALACTACGPSCPAIRLFDFDTESDKEDSPKV
jgi:electron transport complex protein RnfC